MAAGAKTPRRILPGPRKEKVCRRPDLNQRPQDLCLEAERRDFSLALSQLSYCGPGTRKGLRVEINCGASSYPARPPG